MHLVHDTWWTIFQKPNGQVRLACIHMAHSLFMKSKEFRLALMDHLNEFVDLIVNSSTLKPRSSAQSCRQNGLFFLKEWHQAFGHELRPLAICKSFLEQEIGISWDQIHFEQTSQQLQVSQRIQLNRKQKLNDALQEFNEKSMDIKDNLNRMKQCLQLLIPSVDGFDALEPANSQSARNSQLPVDIQPEKDPLAEQLPMDALVKSYGLGTFRYRLNIEIARPTLHETLENQILFDELRHSNSLIQRKHLKWIQEWMSIASKVDEKQALDFLKHLMDIKNELTNACNFLKEIGIQLEKETIILPSEESIESSDDSDEEFIPVTSSPSKPKVIVQEPLKPLVAAGYRPVFDSLERVEPLVESSEAIVHEGKHEVMDAKKRELFSRAPIVPYDQDLDYWDKTQVSMNPSGIPSKHRFLGEGQERNLSADALAELKKRTIVLEPETINVKLMACNARLMNGKLCRRKDLMKCPIHGPIIPRDEQGHPLDATKTVLPIEKPMAEWELLEKDIESNLQPLKKPKTSMHATNSKQRILKKLKKSQKSMDDMEAFEHSLRARDRKVFKW